MKTIPHCLECKQPIHRGIPVFSQNLYGHSLCPKHLYLIEESGATPETIELYLALRSGNFPVALNYFDGYKRVDIALPGKLNIEVHVHEQLINPQGIFDRGQSFYTRENKIPTIVITHSMLDRPGGVAHIVRELIKACRMMIRPSIEIPTAFAPPLTAAQLQ